MRKPLAYAAIYTHLAKYHATQAVTKTKVKAIENKSELTCIAATTVVVGLTARAAGFKAGYEFAKTPNINTTV